MSSTGRQRLQLLDMRQPRGRPLRPLTIKVPGALLQRLSSNAAQLQTPRSVLCRNLLSSGLEQLEAERLEQIQAEHLDMLGEGLQP
jgi:hypothetical protein